MEFIENRKKDLFDLDEVFNNINIKAKLPPIMPEKDKRYQSIGLLVLSIMFFMVGAAVLYSSFEVVISAYANDREITVSKLLGEGFYALLGLLLLYVSYWLARHLLKLKSYSLKHTEKIYNEMLKSHSIIPALITKIQPAHLNRDLRSYLMSLGSGQEIIYTFLSPSERTISGGYVTKDTVDLKIEDEILILYHDDTLHLVI